MTPVTEPTADRLVFETPLSWRKIGAAAACLSVISIVAAYSIAAVSHRLVSVIVVTALVVGAAGTLAAGWRQVLRLDLRERKFDFTRRIGPFNRFVQGELGDIDRVTLRLIPSSNLYGEEELSCKVQLESKSKKMSAAIHAGEPDARLIAQKVAGAAGTHVDELSGISKSRIRSALRLAAAWSGWAGMIAVLAIVVWTATHRSPRLGGQGSFLGRQRPSLLNDYQRGIELYGQKDFKGAEEALKRAIAKVPFFPDAYNELAYALADQGKLNDAMVTAKKALEQSPNSGDILDTVAEMHQRRKEFREAADYYERALRQPMSQGPCQTHTKYGETLVALGRTKEAIWHLEAAAADNIRFNVEWHDRAAAALAKLKGLPPPTPMRRRRGPGTRSVPI